MLCPWPTQPQRRSLPAASHAHLTGEKAVSESAATMVKYQLATRLQTGHAMIGECAGCERVGDAASMVQ